MAHLTERQQTWFNFSQGVELPDPGKYYGIGKYGAAVNGHLPLLSSVNVDDSPLQGIKVNSYELGWRYTGDNLRTQLAAYYSTSDKTIVVNRTDMTIDVQSDKRRIYGVEGAVDYFIPDSDWSVGGNFNVLKSQVQTDGRWQKWDVTLASPSKATAWVAGRRIRGACACRASRCLTSATPPATSWKAITPSILSAVTRCRWEN